MLTSASLAVGSKSPGGPSNPGERPRSCARSVGKVLASILRSEGGEGGKGMGVGGKVELTSLRKDLVRFLPFDSDDDNEELFQNFAGH